MLLQLIIRASIAGSRRLLPPVFLVVVLLLAACEGNPVFVEDESGGPQPTDVKVLFIGNSITMWFNMSVQFEALADSAGKSIFISDISRLGQSLENHLEYANTEASIGAREWDYVVLQERNFAVAFPEYHHLMYPEFNVMQDFILTANSDCNIVMYMDYAPEQVTLLGTLFTFDTLLPKIRSGTIEFADHYGFVIAPVGSAFGTLRAEREDVDIFDADRIHPSEPAQYLQACVYYATIFQESPEGNPFTGNITPGLANYLQRVAAQIVLNEPETWNLPDTP